MLRSIYTLPSKKKLRITDLTIRRIMPKNRAYYDDDDLDDDFDDYIDNNKLITKSSKPNQPAVNAKIKPKVVAPTPKKIEVAKKPSSQNSSGDIKNNIGKEVADSSHAGATAENLAKNVSLVSIKDANDISADISDSKISSNAKFSDDEEQYDPQTLRCNLTIVVAGHVDAGKSTLIGNLLYKTGNVSQKLMHQFEKESSAAGKSSFRFAWVMDETLSERQRGVTIDLAEKVININSQSVTILDAPGHRDFVANMIKGAAQADAALLVVPASEGEFESSMKEGSQTREHAVLLRSLGVSRLLVAVNKMDSTLPTPWSYERYQFIESVMRALLEEELGFDAMHLKFLPVSGLQAENIISLSPGCPLRSWYSQRATLIQELELLGQNLAKFASEKAAISREGTRAIVTGVEDVSGSGQQKLSVRVIRGVIRPGRRYSYFHCLKHLSSTSLTAEDAANAVMVVCRIVKILKDGEATAFASQDLRRGERGIVILSPQLTVIDAEKREKGKPDLPLPQVGTILFKGPTLPQASRRFQAEVTAMMKLPTPIIPGSSFLMYLCGVEVDCNIVKIHRFVDLKAAATAEKSSKCSSGNTVFTQSESSAATVKKPAAPRLKSLPAGRSALVTIEIAGSAPASGEEGAKCNGFVVIEPARYGPALSKFALRSRGFTYGVGTCIFDDY